MKNNKPVITLLGSNSGRNLGDAAILSATLHSLTKAMPQAEFIVPSTNPDFINKNYSSFYNVKGIDVMPWTLSVRLAGLPTFLALKKSDVALICDGIIFGKKFFNPFFNFLITLVPLVKVAKSVKCKLVCYNAGIGPFWSNISKRAARYVMDNSDLVILRDEDSLNLAREIGVSQDISLKADIAFVNPISSKERAHNIMEKIKLRQDLSIIAVNVTSYIDSWLTEEERIKGEGNSFFNLISDHLLNVRNKLQNKVQFLIYSTHPMDEEKARYVAEKTQGALITNSDYLSHDIQAVLKECSLAIGMRFHSLVLASAVGVPVVGLAYAPKVRSLLKQLNTPDLCYELADINSISIDEEIVSAYQRRDIIRTKQQNVVSNLKKLAEEASFLVKDLIYDE